MNCITSYFENEEWFCEMSNFLDFSVLLKYTFNIYQ